MNNDSSFICYIFSVLISTKFQNIHLFRNAILYWMLEESIYLLLYTVFLISLKICMTATLSEIQKIWFE